MTELLPCDWCGGKIGLMSAGGEYQAGCPNMHCPANEVYATEEEAITAWNTRPAPDNQGLELFDNLVTACIDKRSMHLYAEEIDIIKAALTAKPVDLGIINDLKESIHWSGAHGPDGLSKKQIRLLNNILDAASGHITTEEGKP